MIWADAFRLGTSMWMNGVTLSETLLAANTVVAKRRQTIDAALRDPPAADLEELGRMVSEKVAAFGAATGAIAHDLMAMHDDMLAQNRDLVRLILQGWPPNVRTIDRIATRESRLALRMSVAAGRAIAPIHAAATANDRRLCRTL